MPQHETAFKSPPGVEQRLTRPTAARLIAEADKIAGIYPWARLDPERCIYVTAPGQAQPHLCRLTRLPIGFPAVTAELSGGPTLAVEFVPRSKLTPVDRRLLEAPETPRPVTRYQPRFRRRGAGPRYLDEPLATVLLACLEATVGILVLSESVNCWPRPGLCPLVDRLSFTSFDVSIIEAESRLRQL